MKLPKLNFGRQPRYPSLKYPESKKALNHSPRIIDGEQMDDRRYYMRPHEFLSLVTPLDDEAKKVIIRPDDEFTQRRVNFLAKRMKAGRNFEPLFLGVKEGNVISGHEGRHRALAAAQIGVKYLPVDIRSDWDAPIGAFDKTKVRREGSDYKAKHETQQIKWWTGTNPDKEEKDIDEIVKSMSNDAGSINPQGKGKMPGLIRPWVNAPKVTLREVPNDYQSTPDIKTKGIFLDNKKVGRVDYYSDGDVAQFDVDEKHQRKGIGTTALYEVLKDTDEGSVSGESSQGPGKKFWVKQGAEFDYGEDYVLPPFTLDRETYEARQLKLRKKDLGKGPLNPAKVPYAVPEELRAEPTEEELAFTVQKSKPVYHESEDTFGLEEVAEDAEFEREHPEVKKKERKPEAESSDYAGSEEEQNAELEDLYG